MGSKISIDKETSNLEDILQINAKQFKTLKFQNTIPDSIAQHIKMWRISQSPEDQKVQSIPVNLSIEVLAKENFSFQATECYLVLLIYRKSHEQYSSFINFPHTMWGVVESYSNLTPRGLQYPLSNSEFLTELLQKQQLDSFLLPKRTTPKQVNKEFESMIFVWNGKQADPLIKSFGLSKAFDLENQINKGKDSFLQVLFSGGVIENNQLSKGTIIQLTSTSNKQPNQSSIHSIKPHSCLELESEIKQMRQTVFLFKFLFPQGSLSSEEQSIEEDPPMSTVSTAESSPSVQSFKNFQALIQTSTSSYSDNFVHYTPKHVVPEETTQNQQKEIGLPKQSRKVPGLDISKLHKEAMIQMSWGNKEQQMIGEIKSEERTEDGIKIVDRDQVQWKDLEGREQIYERIYGPEFVKRIKMQYFREQCSEIISNLLYLGGEKVAQNEQLLQNIGITHIINCAGDVCNNQFPKSFNYLTFYLKDIKEEVFFQTHFFKFVCFLEYRMCVLQEHIFY